MWAKLMTVKNGYVAAIWKELYDAEGVACRVVPPLTATHSMNQPREIWVPDSQDARRRRDHEEDLAASVTIPEAAVWAIFFLPLVSLVADPRSCRDRATKYAGLRRRRLHRRRVRARALGAR